VFLNECKTNTAFWYRQNSKRHELHQAVGQHALQRLPDFVARQVGLLEPERQEELLDNSDSFCPEVVPVV
jgi:hypothetical protein